MITRRYVLRGRVQGVGFRIFAKRTAERMGIRGEVWNGRDGSVSVIAQHEREDRLDEFEAALWSGPGKVDQVAADPSEPAESYPGFAIVHG